MAEQAPCLDPGSVASFRKNILPADAVCRGYHVGQCVKRVPPAFDLEPVLHMLPGLTEHAHDKIGPPEYALVPLRPLLRIDHLRPSPETPHEASPGEVIPPALTEGGLHVGAVGLPCPGGVLREHPEDIVRVLPGSLPCTHKGTVARPGEGVEVLHGGDDAGTDRVEVDVADKLQEIGLFVADDGLVAVLEELAAALVPPVEGDDITRKEPPHELSYTKGAAPYEEVGVVRHEGPGVAGCLGLRQEGGEPVDEILPVPCIPEYVPSLYAADHDMMEGACCIKAGLTGHGQMIPPALGCVN